MDARFHSERRGGLSLAWSEARAGLVRLLLKKSKTAKKDLRILDAGCGTGSLFPVLGAFGPVTGIEPDPEAAALARSSGNPVISAGLLEAPEDEKYDLICACDVIEHIRDDRAAVRKIGRLLNRDGVLLITVPAFSLLFGPHDQALEHFRRYDKNALERLLREAGFTIISGGYWNSVLFPFEAVYRLLQKHSSPEPRPKTPNTINFRPLCLLLGLILYAENRWLSLGGRLPWGLTYYALATKQMSS